MNAAAEAEDAKTPKTHATIAAVMIQTAEIRPSKYNPRRRFDDAKLKELADSVREKGVIEPIIVRAVTPDKRGTKWEIVAGERRWRAATIAALATLPAIPRELTDAEALEIAVIENDQRENLNPVEAADGYHRLIKDHKYTVEAIAAKAGKSRSYVWQRLRLATLPESTKKALWDEKIPVSIGILIARIPHADMQEEATKHILTDGWTGNERGPMSVREATRYVHQTYMLSLNGAPFDPTDAKLVPAAGACATCPKRTGNNPDLFGDVQRGDTCTDPGCFKSKTEAAWKVAQDAASKTGDSIVSDKDAKNLFHAGGALSWDSEYVDLAAKCEEDPKARHWQRLLGKHVPRVHVARDESGKVHRLIKKADASAALAKAGHKFRGPTKESTRAAYRPSAAAQAAEAKRRSALEAARLTAGAATAAVVAKVEALEPTAAWWRLVVYSFADGSWHDVITTVCKRRGWAVNGNRPEEALRGKLEGLDVAQLRGLLMDLLVTRGAYNHYGTPTLGKPLTRACALLKVDLKKVQAQVREGIAARTAAKKGGKKKARAAR